MSDLSDDDAAADRPVPYRRSAGVSVSAGDEGSGKVFLRTAAGTVFSFGEHEYFLWRALNGRATWSGIERGFESNFSIALTQADMAAFIAQCLQGGLVDHHEVGDDPGPDLPLAEFPAARAQSGAQPGRGSAAAALLHGIREPWVVKIGDPTRLFAVLAVVFGPLRHVRWLCLPGAFLAGMIVLKHLAQFQADWAAVKASVPYWPLLYVFEHVLNIVARVSEGTIVQAHGGTVRYFALRFLLVIVIRGLIDEHAAKSMPRHVRIWSKAGVLLIRLAIIDIAILMWISMRTAHPLTARGALFIGVLSFILFCINVCPLVMAEGYEVLATSMNQPHLAGRAFKLLGLRLRGRRPPANVTAAERIGLTFFAVGTVLSSALIGVGLLFDMGNYITTNLQGLGYLVMAVVLSCAILYVVLVVRYNRRVSTALRALGADAMRAQQPEPAPP